MLLKTLAVIAVFAGVGPALAQNGFGTTLTPPTTITTTRVGNATFQSGTVAGQPFSSTSQTVGGTTFTNGMVGDQSFSGVQSTIIPPTTTATTP